MSADSPQSLQKLATLVQFSKRFTTRQKHDWFGINLDALLDWMRADCRRMVNPENRACLDFLAAGYRRFAEQLKREGTVALRAAA